MKRIVSLLLVWGVLLGFLFPCMDVNAAQQSPNLLSMKFDLGGKGAASGYIGVSATEAYSASKGYGFYQTHLAQNVETPGQGALSDAVRFGGANGRFCVDLPNGVYRITVTTGNDVSSIITAEGASQLFFLTGNHAVDSFTIPVTDGQLDIYTTSGVGDVHSISAIEIQQVAAAKPVIWIAGDSTAATYYNVPEGTKRGWGMYLRDYIDTNKYDVRNISISGLRASGLRASAFPTVESFGKTGDIILFAVGINDYADEHAAHPDAVDPSAYISDMTYLVQRAKAKGMQVYLVQEHCEPGEFAKYPLIKYKWFGRELEAIAKSEKVGWIDLVSPWLEQLLLNYFFDQKEYYADGIHPNAEGADILARMVSEQLFPDPTPVDHGDLIHDFKTAATAVYETQVAGAPISNPHKGFSITAYVPNNVESSHGFEYGIGGSADNHAWDCCTIVTGEPKWSVLNPEPGVYNWAYIDDMLDVCGRYGLTYGIRVLPFSSYNSVDYVPQWVYEAGAKKNKATRWDRQEEIEFPKWDDPVYLQAHKDFVTAMAKKYDGDPRVEYVDVRPFGDFGEWHNSFTTGDYMPSIEIQKDMLAYYASAFKKTLLALPNGVKGEVYRYALSLGITRRDDGLICTPNEEWDLVPAYRANMPTIGENLWPYRMMKHYRDVRANDYDYINWSPQRLRETIEIGHLSIMALDQDSYCSYEFYKEHQAFLDEMCNRLGYNYTVISAARQDNKLAVTIQNTGVAPSYFNIRLCAEITDASGRKIESFGTPVVIEKGTFREGTQKTFLFEYPGRVPAGATICLAMYDMDNKLVAGKDPTIRFDNKNNLPNKRLKLVEKSGLPKVTVRSGSSAELASGVVGDTIKITATASGTGTLKYQWQSRKDSNSVWVNSAQSGAKTATLSVATTAGLHGWQFRCIVTDSKGQRASEMITMSLRPKITKQPASTTITVGNTAKFTIAATGRGTLKYQWQSRKDAASAWTNSGQSGAKTDTLSVATTPGLHGWQFRCVVTDGNGQKSYSNAVSVYTVPKITKQAVSTTVTAGSTVKFMIAATGRGPLAYQWQSRKNSTTAWTNSAQSGAKTAALSVATSKGLNGWQFRCIVTDGNGQKSTSNTVNVYVK